MWSISKIVVVVFCLVGALDQANANWLGRSKPTATKAPKYIFKKPSQPDFPALNQYFMQKPGNMSNEGLIGGLKIDINNLEGDMKRAGELLLKIWDFDTSQCSDDALDLLKQIRLANLSIDEHKQTNLIINRRIVTLVNTCAQYIGRTVEQQSRACLSDPKLAKLMEILSPGYIIGLKTTQNESQVERVSDFYIASRPYKVLNGVQAANILREMVKSEATFDANGKIIGVDDDQQKAKLFEDYLVNPCKEFLSKFSPLFDGLKDILMVENNLLRYKNLNALGFTDLACRTITSMSDMDKANLYEAL